MDSSKNHLFVYDINICHLLGILSKSILPFILSDICGFISIEVRLSA